MKEIKSLLSTLENSFGPFPQGSVTVFARENVSSGMARGMEHVGAMSTDFASLRHELDHSYIARSVIPANGDAGWIDDATAKWGDSGYPRNNFLPKNKPVNMSGRSPYFRTTGGEAYEIGRDFMAYLDYIHRERGKDRGLKDFLKIYAKGKRHQSVTALEFQELVEDFYGGSLQQEFEEYVYKT